MAKLLVILGWCLSVLGILGFLTAVLAAFDADNEKTDAVLGLLMLGAFFGVPGGFILWGTKKTAREQRFRAEFTGFLRSHDEFTITEMAQKIGRTELETEQLVARAITEDKLDLVFHRADRRYLHRNRIRQSFKVFERCSACGGQLRHELALEGEVVSCPYCGSPVEG